MNEIIRCGLKEDIMTRSEKGMLRWFGHLKSMDESKKLSGKVGRGRNLNDQIILLIYYLNKEHNNIVNCLKVI